MILENAYEKLFSKIRSGCKTAYMISCQLPKNAEKF